MDFSNFMNINLSKFGDSFYVLDEQKFIEDYKSLLKAFQEEYKETNIGYSYKTNYIPDLCRAVKRLGGYAEVVSEMEYEVSQKIGVQKNRVFLNGPYKNKKCMEDILLNGGFVNLDCERDLRLIEEISANHLGINLHIGLRCNFDIDDGLISRFGFCFENKSLEKAIDYLSKFDNVIISGLHCHFASRSLSAWNNATDGMIEILNSLKSKLDSDLKFISLGGGLFGKVPKILKKQLGPDIPSFEEYASVSARKLNDYFDNNFFSSKPILFIEPGTAIAAGALSFVTKIIDIKDVRGKQIITTAGSAFNFNPSMSQINLPIEIVKNTESNYEEVVFKNASITGYTCIEKDILYRDFSGNASIEDFIIFHEAGSYSVVMKPPFILPNVPIIKFDNTKMKFSIVKRQESFDDVFRTFKFNE